MPFYNKSRKCWVGAVCINNQRQQKSFGTKREAKEWESQIRQGETPKQAYTETLIISLHDFATRYLDYSKAKHSKKTYKEKVHTFRVLLKSLSPEKNIFELHKGDVLEHLKNQALDRSGYAANKDRKNLVAAWNWAAEYIEDFPSKNPFRTAKFAEIRSHRYIPTLDDFWKVLSNAESDQDRVMLLCYLHLAARRNEIFCLHWQDIDFNHRKVKLYTRKRRDGSLEYDWLPLTDLLFKELSEHRRRSDNHEWVFPNPKNNFPYVTRLKWMKRICTAAGVKPFGHHSIRHLTASILIQQKVSLIDIQTILRHKNITTTQRYLHRLEGIRGVVAKLPIPDK